MLNGIKFADPQFFYLLLIIPFLIGWKIYQLRKKQPGIVLSSLQGFANYKPTLRQRLIHLPFALRMLSIALLITVLARPQSSSKSQSITSEGIDIILAFDVSGSMLAEDFKPNRIEAAKDLAIEFIQGRPGDRIGLVVFSGESFSQCPLTTDHSVLINLFEGVTNEMLLDGTALGEGLANAVSRIKDSKSKSKVVVLMTDGVNNSGSIAPLTAAEIAKTFDIRVYTIGIGTQGFAPYPFKTPFGIQYQQVPVDIDEPTMKQIAAMTDGKYFRATGNQKLKTIFADIDKLEKSKIDVTEFSRHSEEFLPFALIAGLCLLLEVLLRNTIFRTLP